MLFCRFIEESKETDDDEEYQFIKAGRKLFTYITYSRKLITRLRQGLLLGRVKRIVPYEDKNQNIKIT